MHYRPRLYNSPAQDSGRFSSGKRFVAFAGFVILSGILWISLSLRQEVPVAKRFLITTGQSQMPDDAVISFSENRITVKFKSTLPDSINNRIRSLGNKIPVNARYLTGTKGKLNTAALVREAFSIPDNISFSVSPEYIRYEKTTLKTKKVKLNTDHAILPDKGWEIAGKPQFEQDSIIIKGAEKILAKTKSLDVIPQRLVPGQARQHLTLKIKTPNGIIPEKETVEVDFQAAPFTLKEFEIPVTSANNGRVLKFLPDRVRLQVKSPLKALNNITADDFVIQANPTPTATSRYANLSVTKLPPGVKIIRIIPDKVEYIEIIREP